MNFKLSNLMKLPDFSKEIKIPESTVRTWKRRGDIPPECFLILGSTVFIKLDKFYEFTEQRKVG